MRSLLFFLASYGLYRFFAGREAVPRPVSEPAPTPAEADGQGVGLAVQPPDWKPAEGAAAAQAYDGLPVNTPVVYIDGNGQVRETNAVYLSQALAAAVLMRDPGFLPQSEEPPRLAPGTGDLPGRGYVL